MIRFFKKLFGDKFAVVTTPQNRVAVVVCRMWRGCKASFEMDLRAARDKIRFADEDLADWSCEATVSDGWNTNPFSWWFITRSLRKSGHRVQMFDTPNELQTYLNDAAAVRQH